MSNGDRRLVPEVVLGPGVDNAHNFMAQHPHLQLCSQVFFLDDLGAVEAPPTAPACHSASDFNEFSTLDLQMNQHLLMVLHAYVVDGEGALDDCVTFEACKARGRVMEGSETYFPLNTARPEHFQGWHFRCGATITIPVAVDAVVHHVPIILSEETALQHTIADLCRYHAVDEAQCAKLALYAFNLAAPHAALMASRLPSPQLLPSPERPFVFLHLEKCAGTSLRRYIAQAALDRGIGFHVPCFDPNDATGPHITPWVHGPGSPLTCMSFDASTVDPTQRPKLGILAGHFQWGVWRELQPQLWTSNTGATVASRGVETTAKEGPEEDDNVLFQAESESGGHVQDDEATSEVVAPSCFMMLRDPVDRVISYYYERLYPSSGEIFLNDLDIGTLEWFLQNYIGSSYSRWRDEGLSNAACKMVLGLNDRKGRFPNETDHLPGPAQVKVNTELAIRRLRSCVVGLTSQWEDTKRILPFWFPWLTFTDNVRGNVGMGSKVETPATLNPQARAIIEDYNRCDLEMYSAALDQFQEQVDIIGSLVVTAKAPRTVAV